MQDNLKVVRLLEISKGKDVIKKVPKAIIEATDINLVIKATGLAAAFLANYYELDFPQLELDNLGCQIQAIFFLSSYFLIFQDRAFSSILNSSVLPTQFCDYPNRG